MKVKRYLIKGLLTLTFISGFVSCSGFLDETNYSSQSADEYFQTKTGYEGLINGCYSRLRTIYNSKEYISLGCLGTDICTQNNTIGLSNLNQYPVNYDANEGSVYTMWNNLYAALKDANAAIDRSDKVILLSDDPDGLADDVLEQRVAEAKALRALFLFEIVRNWGQAPLMIHEPLAPVKTAELSDGAQFYTQILSDLEDAIRILPARQTGSDYGRMSASAAKHLRALVYLTRGYESYADSRDFENAYKDAVDVINNSGHKLLEDFQMVHCQSNETNDEIIFSVGFSTGANHNVNNWPKWFLFPYREGWAGLSKDSYYSNDDAAAIPTKFAYMMYDWFKDRRASVTFMSPLNGDPKTSTDGRDTGKNWFQCTGAIEGVFEKGDTVIYFPVPTDSKFKHWSQADKDAVKYKVYNFPTGDPADMSSDDYFKLGYQSTNSNTRAFLPVWKFKDANTVYNENGNASGSRDIYMFRLAETCLIAAEAAVKNNDNINALYYINKVRERAAKNALETGLSLYTGTVTLDDVLDERAMELFAEVPRWNDLQRTRKLAERVLKYNWDTRNIAGGIPTQLTEESFLSKYIRRPIPLTWLNSLSNGQELGNNPGWQ